MDSALHCFMSIIYIYVLFSWRPPGDHQRQRCLPPGLGSIRGSGADCPSTSRSTDRITLSKIRSSCQGQSASSKRRQSEQIRKGGKQQVRHDSLDMSMCMPMAIAALGSPAHCSRSLARSSPWLGGAHRGGPKHGLHSRAQAGAGAYAPARKMRRPLTATSPAGIDTPCTLVRQAGEARAQARMYILAQQLPPSPLHSRPLLTRSEEAYYEWN